MGDAEMSLIQITKALRESNERMAIQFEEQRTLVSKQSRNANIMMFATIIMALATIGMFIVGYLQYDNSKKVEDVYRKLQVPELRAK